MRLTAQIDLYIRDQFASGRFSSDGTARGYRWTLGKLAEHVGNRDARTISREELKELLGRWRHPNTQSVHRAHLVSFFDWCMEEGIRRDNPARQTRKPRKRKATIYRLTREEAMSMRLAAHPGRETWAIDLGLLAGLRAQELLGLQGRHLRRPGWVWVSADIAKGKKQRWVPVLSELEESWRQICLSVEDHHYVLPAWRRTFVLGEPGETMDPTLPGSYKPLLKTVKRIGARAGIAHQVTPHMLRHAFGDHIARYAGMKAAQFVMGHESVATTEKYTGQLTLDEVAHALAGFAYGLPHDDSAAMPAVESAARILREPGGRDGQRDWDVRGFAEVLAWLWHNPAIRRAAREMADAR